MEPLEVELEYVVYNWRSTLERLGTLTKKEEQNQDLGARRSLA
jgi:hypothetical protein